MQFTNENLLKNEKITEKKKQKKIKVNLWIVYKSLTLYSKVFVSQELLLSPPR